MAEAFAHNGRGQTHFATGSGHIASRRYTREYFQVSYGSNRHAAPSPIYYQMKSSILRIRIVGHRRKAVNRDGVLILTLARPISSFHLEHNS
jgi:hypothetical protein